MKWIANFAAAAAVAVVAAAAAVAPSAPVRLGDNGVELVIIEHASLVLRTATASIWVDPVGVAADYEGESTGGARARVEPKRVEGRARAGRVRTRARRAGEDGGRARAVWERADAGGGLRGIFRTQHAADKIPVPALLTGHARTYLQRTGSTRRTSSSSRTRTRTTSPPA